MEETNVSPEATEAQAPEQTENSSVEQTPENIEATPEATTVDEVTGETLSETLYADKFKSVGDLENSYKELQSTFSKKLGAFEGAPEDGYKLPEGDYDQNLSNFIQDWGKENQLSNDGLNTLVKSYDAHKAKTDEATMRSEFTKLGENAEARLRDMRGFLSANLGEEATMSLAGVLSSAEAIQAVEALIKQTKSPTPAPSANTNTMSKEKIKDMRFAKTENGDRRMSVDPEYRARVMKLESQLLGSGSDYVVRD